MANNLTRIQNNQITDSTIQAQAKLAAGSITGNLLASTVTFNSNITILGNLTVANSYTQLNSINTYINDPVVVFNNNYTGSLTNYDIGILVNRNLASLGAYGSVNTFLGWSESAQAFIAVATTETGTNVSSINNSGYANVVIGNLVAGSGSFSGTITAPSMTIPVINATSGNITTLYSTNFSTGNAVITGGYAQGLSNVYATLGSITNFSSANTRIASGYADNFPIGANTAATGAFTTLVTSGNLTVNGNVIVPTGTLNLGAGNLIVNKSSYLIGDATTGLNAVFAGVPTGFTALPYTTVQISSNINSYTQTNSQNLNSGNQATTDYIVTSDNGTDTTNYADLGIASSGYVGTSPINSLGNILYPNDSYLYSKGTTSGTAGGNLVIGAITGSKSIKFLVGGVNNSDMVAVLNTPSTAATSPTTGALVVTGGIGFTGNLNGGSFNNSIHNIQGNVLLGQGSRTASADSILTINLNTDTPIVSNATVHLSASTGKNAIYGADSFGTGNTSAFFGRHARGTSTTPTAVQAGDPIVTFQGRGYGATGYAFSSVNPGLSVYASENYTDTAQGAGINLNYTPTGSIAAVLGLRIDPVNGGNVQIFSTTGSGSATSGALTVIGGIGVGGNSTFGANLTVNGNAIVAGNLTVNGTFEYINTTITTHVDPVLELNTGMNGTALAVDNLADVGLKMHYFDTADRTSFVGRAHDSGFLEYYAIGTESGNVFSGTYGTIKGGAVLVSNSTTATSTTSGALQVTGGAGIGGNLYIGSTMFGTATSAKYADLAENYQGDKPYTPGTVVMFGGVAEITVADADSTAVAGVISTNPAHLMNGALSGPNVAPVAFTGRVPCNVIGPVKKGDLMVSAGFGFAKVNNKPAVGTVIGKALQDYPVNGKGSIEVVVGRF